MDMNSDYSAKTSSR